MKKKMHLIPVVSLMALTACVNTTVPDTPECPEPPKKTVERQWFYGRVNELKDMQYKTFVQRVDWMADLLEELDVEIKGLER